jgi:hypothetical protein
MPQKCKYQIIPSKSRFSTYQVQSKVSNLLDVNIHEKEDYFYITLGVLRTPLPTAEGAPSEPDVRFTNLFDVKLAAIKWQEWQDARHKNSRQWKKKKKKGGRT